jgi:3-phenylpropionate/cinnamic acid dioxygenase small subunit
MSALYRTPSDQLTAQLAGVRERYDALAADLATAAAAPIADPVLSAEVAMVLRAEARLLDAGNWPRWLDWCAADTLLWVPLNVRAAHPGDDQSLFLDDRRRLDERIWRFTDPNAWALNPPGLVTRAVSAVEAWEAEPGQILAAGVLGLQHVRGRTRWATQGRQVHRLRRSADGSWQLVHKIMLIPALEAGSPHLGWLL